MRDQLNNNPVAQAAVVAVLLIGALFFFMSSKGGGGESEAEGSADAPAAIEEVTATGALPAEAAASAPPPPPAVIDAVEADQTVVLLFVREHQKLPNGLAEPFVFLGPATFRSGKGERPMQIEWKLAEPMPEWLYRQAAVLAR